MSLNETTAGRPAVIDRYQVRELLGQGAFGAVYRAFDPRLERDVALKVLHPGRMTSHQAVERFLREARVAARLHHPHIVPVHDAGRAGDAYYIASAFIPGKTLAAALPVGGMEPRRAAELAAQLASALGYAHQQGVLHRDVKPENILLDERDSLHLMDFGLAGWTQDENTRLTQEGAVIGTPLYMSPEQAAGNMDVAGPRSDLYSAGVVLYVLLTGRLPFEASPSAALVYRILHTAPAPPSRFQPGLDAELEAFCLKALAKRPEERFESGEEMAAALAGWAADAPTPGPDAASRPRTPPAAQDDRPDRPRSATQSTAPAAAGRGDRSHPHLRWAWWGGASLVALTGLVIADIMYHVSLHGAPHPEPRRADGQEPLRAEAPFDVTEAKRVQQAWADYLGVPLSREVDLGRGVRMKLALIPPGSFQMGSPEGEKDHRRDEKRHPVEITRPFYLGFYEVTRGQFAAFVDAEHYQTDAETDGQGGCGYNAATRALDQTPTYSWRNVGFGQTDDDPVVNVTWHDATTFSRWVSKKAETRCELPTEAEWEYACRAGTRTRFWCGGTDEDLKGNANLADASLLENVPRATWAVPWDNGYPFTSPVGTFKANAWGLYDTHGNVWEWCSDYYDADYYAKSPMSDPVNLGQSATRVQRGGSWHDAPWLCRSALRLSAAPITRNCNVGFRVVLCLD